MTVAWEGEVQYGDSSFIMVSGSNDNNLKWLEEKYGEIVEYGCDVVDEAGFIQMAGCCGNVEQSKCVVVARAVGPY